MKRRSFLAAAAAAPAGLMLPDIGFAMQQGELSTDVARALAEFRKSIPSNFDHDYVEHAVIPFFLSTVFEAERPALPMIDVTLSKQNALPYDLWGLIYKQWKPTPEEGVTVFLQGLEQRGDHNLRKRIYASAVTPDLYQAMYHDKVAGVLRPPVRPAVRRTSRSCGTTSTTTSTSTGICTSACRARRFRRTSGRSVRASTPCSRIAIRETRSSTSTT